MNDNERLDKILDEALSEYREAEPLAGLEDRVLQRLQGRKRAGTSLWLRWGLAAACLAVVVMAVWIGMARRTPESVTPAKMATPQPIAQAPVQTPAPAVAGPVVKAGELRGPARHHAGTTTPAATVAHSVPSVFPLPVPLTAQEQAFLAIVQGNADSGRLATGLDDTLVIAKIEIKPLESSGTLSGEKQ